MCLDVKRSIKLCHYWIFLFFFGITLNSLFVSCEWLCDIEFLLVNNRCGNLNIYAFPHFVFHWPQTSSQNIVIKQRSQILFYVSLYIFLLNAKCGMFSNIRQKRSKRILTSIIDCAYKNRLLWSLWECKQLLRWRRRF